jgi:hypothetical protein
VTERGAGRSLTFKTVEYYSNGKNAYWIGPPSAAFPAPTINVTRAGGVVEDVAGNEAGPPPGFVPTGQATTASGGSSDTLAVVAAILAAVALGIAAVGVVTRRRPA